MRRSRVAWPLLVLAVAAVPRGGAAEALGPEEAFARRLAVWARALDRIDQLAAGSPSMAELDGAYGEAAAIAHEAAEARRLIAAELAPVREELGALGPRPPADAPAEAPSVQALRERLEGRAALVDARMKQAEVVLARAQALGREVRLAARARVADRLFTRGPPPLDPATWPPALASLRALGREIVRALRERRVEGVPVEQGARPFLWVVFLVALALAATLPVRAWLLRSFGRGAGEPAPDPGRRQVAAAAEAVARSLVACVPLVVLDATLADLGLVQGRAAVLVRAAVVGLLIFLLVTTFARAALPPAAAWRLAPLDDRAAPAVRRRIMLCAVLFALTAFLVRATRGLDAQAPALASLAAVVLTIPLAAILMPLAARRLWQRREAQGKPPPGGWLLFHLAFGVVVVAMPLAALAGWSRLAFEINRAIAVAVIVSSGFLAVRTLAGALLAHAAGSDRGAAAPAESAAAFWLRLALDVLLFPTAVVLWLLAIGVPPSLLKVLAGTAVRTIQIGSLRIAPADVVVAVVAFAVILGIVRFLVRTLEERILPRTDLAIGTQQTLAAAVSYLGLALALAVAISALGLDLSNLAIIAGALSVGIGFGLQNVVNNFVSGLIMLAERPIKVGDWVVIGNHEGTVRRINVRATEIESFQRSAVLIPNSEVLSSAVVNWTHRDKFGRLDLRVSVAYGSDVEKVREILLKCARAHDRVASVPPPYVLFRDFGESGLDFELRAFVSNVEERLFVTSDLRFAIDAAFRRAAIEIPFPQRDLRLRDIDRLERALAGRAPDPKPDDGA